MFNVKRNQVIITLLVFMIAIAAYLNTQEPNGNIPMNLVDNTAFNEKNLPEEEDFFESYDATTEKTKEALSSGVESNNNEVAQTETDKEDIDKLQSNGVLPEEELTGGQSFQALITKKESTSEVAAVNNNKSGAVAGDDYFAEEKLLREQSRAQQVEKLTEYVANENLDQETKAKAAENLLEIQERIEKESGAEALLRAKGFKEVYVRIDDDGVDVVVSKSELSDTDITQIEEIVNRKTGFSVGKIKITPLNSAENN
ncbi:SpoIIIAH-like family protein [Cellulosilyticum ruminicola]|uniref:SpoIIIAH-like family protein n=1 Tax=Cellulosilyticum ruminicola TaxID=425254 RepID=UPI0006D0E66D|nr:SpoIIIAH-like family protein [Cellulosilyticum ruminicola]